MSSYVQKETTAITADLRQVAEGEAVAGPQAVMGLPGSITLGPGATLTMTEAGNKEQMESMNSVVGNLLGIQSQMAQGIFALAPAIANQTTQTQGLFQSKLSELGMGLSELGTTVGTQTKESNKLVLAAIAGIGLLLLVMRK